MIINNLKELREIWRLSDGDHLVFCGSIFAVCSNYLYIMWATKQKEAVNKLFKSVNKRDFCSDAYWYSSTEWIFPNYRNDDYVSAYRVAEKIYIEILWQDSQDKFKRWDKVRIRSLREHISHLLWKEYIINDINDGYITLQWDDMRSYRFTESMLERVGDCWKKSIDDYSWLCVISWKKWFKLLDPESELAGKLYTESWSYTREWDSPIKSFEMEKRDWYKWCKLLDPEAKIATEKKSIMQLVKEAEISSGETLIYDLNRTDICGTAFSFPSSSSCATIPQEKSEKCCPTAEKKRHKRFKIQDFLNDRDRK